MRSRYSRCRIADAEISTLSGTLDAAKGCVVDQTV